MAFNPTLLVATGLHRGRNSRSREEDNAQLNSYLKYSDYSPSSVQRRLDVVDNHISYLRDGGPRVYSIKLDLDNVRKVTIFFSQMLQIMVLEKMCKGSKSKSVK